MANTIKDMSSLCTRDSQRYDFDISGIYSHMIREFKTINIIPHNFHKCRNGIALSCTNLMGAWPFKHTKAHKVH